MGRHSRTFGLIVAFFPALLGNLSQADDGRLDRETQLFAKHLIALRCELATVEACIAELQVAIEKRTAQLRWGSGPERRCVLDQVRMLERKLARLEGQRRAKLKAIKAVQARLTLDARFRPPPDGGYRPLSNSQVGKTPSRVVKTTPESPADAPRTIPPTAKPQRATVGAGANSGRVRIAVPIRGVLPAIKDQS